MKEIEFNPATMQRATPEDIARIWKQLWGTNLFLEEDGELLDLTQTRKEG